MERTGFVALGLVQVNPSPVLDQIVLPVDDACQDPCYIVYINLKVISEHSYCVLLLAEPQADYPLPGILLMVRGYECNSIDPDLLYHNPHDLTV